MIVIFDLDGTVWDSPPGIVGSLVHTFELLDMDVPDRDVLVRHVGPPLRSMLSELGVEDDHPDRAAVAYRDRYTRTGVYEAELYPGVVDLPDSLRGGGHRPATATSKGHDPTLIMLDHFGIHDRFDFVGAAEHHIECIGVRWGYGGEDALTGAGTWAVAHSPAEVLSLIGQR